jgi:Ran-binding protein 3
LILTKTDQTTGEEGEKTAFSANAKLYQLVEGQWSERGAGVFKLNYTMTDLPQSSQYAYEHDNKFDYTDIEPGKASIEARFIMRNAATHKVIINARIFKEMRVGDAEGKEPSTKNQFLFSANTDGRLAAYYLRVSLSYCSEVLMY